MKKNNLIAALCGVTLIAAGCTAQPAKSPETRASEISGEVTISCYDSALYLTFLEEAARQFEQQYPDVRITIDSFSEMPQVNSFEQDGEQIQAIVQDDDPQGRADYISKINTSLMSGNGADLLAMDVLPLDQYVESGQLENLKDYMQNDTDFKKADYRENILTALEFDNGLWFMPLDYSFDYYAYDSSLASEQNQNFGPTQAFTTRQIIELGKSAFDGNHKILPAPAYLPSGSGDLFSQLFRESYQAFVDAKSRNAHFNDGQFQEMIEEIKSLADAGYISHSIDSGASDYLQSALEDPTERFLFKPRNQFALVQQTHPDPEFQMALSTSDVGSGIVSDDKLVGICADQSGIVPFTYNMAFGMNANSKNKQAAWAILKYLLSYEVQASPSMVAISLPLHNQARTDRAKELYQTLMTGGADLGATEKTALSNYLDAVETMSDQINGYTYKDSTIQDMVISEMAYYFAGSKSSGQVCEVLQSKVELYLNE